MSTKRKRDKNSAGGSVRPEKRASNNPVEVSSVECLPDELWLEIMAMLPTFEDRYVLGVVCKRWKSIYRILLKPHNDTLASKYLDPPWMTLDEDSCGPSLVDWNRRPPWVLPTCAFQFYYGGTCLVQLFGLYSLNHIYCCYWSGKRAFEISRETEPTLGPWILHYRCGKKSYKNIELPNPCQNGDIFDQVPRAKDAFRFDSTTLQEDELDLLPNEEEWKEAVSFDSGLARRIYNFPYFVKRRQELEARKVAFVD